MAKVEIDSYFLISSLSSPSQIQSVLLYNCGIWLPAHTVDFWCEPEASSARVPDAVAIIHFVILNFEIVAWIQSMVRVMRLSYNKQDITAIKTNNCRRWDLDVIIISTKLVVRVLLKEVEVVINNSTIQKFVQWSLVLVLWVHNFYTITTIKTS